MVLSSLKKAKCPKCGHIFPWSDKDSLEILRKQENIDSTLLRIIKHNKKIKQNRMNLDIVFIHDRCYITPKEYIKIEDNKFKLESALRPIQLHELPKHIRKTIKDYHYHIHEVNDIYFGLTKKVKEYE